MVNDRGIRARENGAEERKAKGKRRRRKFLFTNFDEKSETLFNQTLLKSILFFELSAGRAPFAGIKNSMARIIRREMEKLEGRGDKASVLDSETPFISSNGILY